MSISDKLLHIDQAPALRRSSYVGMFDLPKGLLMLTIIAFHSVNDYSWFTLWALSRPLPLRLLLSPLTLVHYGLIPALFMICGFGERKERLTHGLWRHISPLIKPYICVMIVVMICVPLRQMVIGESVSEGLREQGLAFLLGLHLWIDGTGNIGPLWFAMTYVTASLLLNLLLRVRQEWLRWLLIIAGSAMGIIFNRMLIPFCVQQGLICAGIMYAGMRLRLRKALTRRPRIWLCLLVWLMCIVAMAFNGYAEFSLALFRLGLFDLAMSYAAGYALLRLLLQLNVLQGRLPDALRWVGRHMFWVCCVHTAVCLAVPWEHFVALFEHNRIPGFMIEFLIQLIVALAGCWLIDRFARKHHQQMSEKEG